MLQIGLFINGRLIDSIDIINDAKGVESDAHYNVHYETTSGEDKEYHHTGHHRGNGPWVLARDILNNIMADGSLDGRKDVMALRHIVFSALEEKERASRKSKG